MSRIFYSLLLTAILPLVLLRLLYRSLANPDYRSRILERFGFGGLKGLGAHQSIVLIHAVSVGEVIAATSLIEELLAKGSTVLVTTMTPTGSDTVRAKFGERVLHCYLPYDLPWSVRHFLTKVQPQLIILMETELWPNLVHVGAQRGIPVILANGRLSKRSAKGYGRFPNLSSQMLSKFDHIAAQSPQDAQRLIALGACPEKMTITGSLKFTISATPKNQTRDSFMQSILDSKRPVLIAASTRLGEEEKVLTAFKIAIAKVPELLLVIVPRHPERFDQVAGLVKQSGIDLLRRSDMRLLKQNHQVFLGDSMGEMMAYYSLAKLAFVGGSLVDTGCQNVLEPAALGIPVLVGPSQYNFETICQQLESAGALITVQDEADLAKHWLSLLSDTSKAKKMGTSAMTLVSENQQALPKLLAIIDKVSAN
ncbi:MAG: lipid IV(A) 3-deoxy-D-manno-octulosonic acid transferase [Pseudohongiellaceae bacterium]